MVRKDKVYCDSCNQEIHAVTPEEHSILDYGCWSDWKTAKNHTCERCWSRAFDEFDPPCWKCRTPNRCKNDTCWADPPELQIWGYENYLAPRLKDVNLNDNS